MERITVSITIIIKGVFANQVGKKHVLKTFTFFFSLAILKCIVVHTLCVYCYVNWCKYK